jgi:hypothetical protein
MGARRGFALSRVQQRVTSVVTGRKEQPGTPKQQHPQTFPAIPLALRQARQGRSGAVPATLPPWFEHNPRLPTPSHPTVPTNTPPHPARIACSTRPLLHPPRPCHRSASNRTDGVPNSRRCHGQVSSQLPADPPLRLPTDPCLQRYGILEAWYGRQCSHPA